MRDIGHLSRDSEGYLLDPSQWNETVATAVAQETGLELTDDHWNVLQFMREYLTTEGIAPDVRHVVEFLVGQGKLDKKHAKEHLFKLFPYGYMQQACKVAGFQRPRAWSTG